MDMRVCEMKFDDDVRQLDRTHTDDEGNTYVHIYGICSLVEPVDTQHWNNVLGDNYDTIASPDDIRGRV